MKTIQQNYATTNAEACFTAKIKDTCNLPPKKALNYASVSEALEGYISQKITRFSDSVFLKSAIFTSTLSAITVECLNENYSITSKMLWGEVASHFLWVPLIFQILCLFTVGGLFLKLLCFVSSMYSVSIPVKLLINEFFKKDFIINNVFISIKRIWSIPEYCVEARSLANAHSVKFSSAEILNVSEISISMTDLRNKMEILIYLKLNPSFFEKVLNSIYSSGPGIVSQALLMIISGFAVKMLVTSVISFTDNLFWPISKFWCGDAVPLKEENSIGVMKEVIHLQNQEFTLKLSEQKEYFSKKLLKLFQRNHTNLQVSSEQFVTLQKESAATKLAMRGLFETLFPEDFPSQTDEQST